MKLFYNPPSPEARLFAHHARRGQGAFFQILAVCPDFRLLIVKLIMIQRN